MSGAAPIHERIDRLAARLVNVDALPTARDVIIRCGFVAESLRILATELRNSEMRDDPPHRSAASSAIIAAIRGSTCDSDLADVWRETKAHRLGLPTAEQTLIVMAWIDQATALAMDDGR